MLLQILLYVWLAFVAFSASVVVMAIGKARRPITPANALGYLLLVAIRTVLIATVLWQLRN